MKYSFQTLDIRGYRQEPVPHTFFQQDQGSEHAALVCAGYRNNCQHPTLYYPTRELLARGVDVLLLDYCFRPDFFALSNEEVNACVRADTLAAYQALVRQRAYRRLTLIGKSLGTMALGHLITAVEHLPAQTEVIWQTPLLSRLELCQQIRQAHPRSLFVIGTADSYYDASALAELEAVTRGASLVIEGVDHLLETPEGIVPSLQVMERIMQTIQAFLDRK